MRTRLLLESSSDVAGIGFGDWCWDGGHRGWGLSAGLQAHTGLGSPTPQGLPSTLLKNGRVLPEAGVRGGSGLGHSWFGLVLPTSGTEQMLSHGTADVVLEACTDFWDGADIYPLSGSDRWVRKHPSC